jgi:hypothetical protein
MSKDRQPDHPEHIALRITREIDLLCDEFKSMMVDRDAPSMASFVDRVEPVGRRRRLEKLVSIAFEYLKNQGHPDPVARLLESNAELADELEPLRK